MCEVELDARNVITAGKKWLGKMTGDDARHSVCRVHDPVCLDNGKGIDVPAPDPRRDRAVAESGLQQEARREMGA